MRAGDYYGSPKACIYNPQMSSSQFMELVRLCSDHTVLGNHLLTMAKSISTTEQHLSATSMLPWQHLQSSCTLKVKVKGQNCSPVIYCWYTKNLVFSFRSLLPFSCPHPLSLSYYFCPSSLLPPPFRPGNPGRAAGTCPWLLHPRLLCRRNCRGVASD